MTHADLIDRLKAGSGPDRELHTQIWCALVPGWTVPFSAADGWVVSNDPNDCSLKKVNEYTTSLDACIGLMREVLPGWDWEKFKGNHIVMLEPIDTVHFTTHDYPGSCGHADLCRALLIAILQAVGDAG